jgi:hypothetical protein
MVCDASERRLNSSAKMCHRYEEAVTQTTSLLVFLDFVDQDGFISLNHLNWILSAFFCFIFGSLIFDFLCDFVV